MNDGPMIFRIARTMLAEQPPGQRKKDKDLTKPVNSPKGIDKGLVREHGKPMAEGHDDTVSPHRRDIRPEDVFFPKPHQIGVLNLVQTGKDLSRAIENQVPKDKGFDAVKNLSQYLIETGGGGG